MLRVPPPFFLTIHILMITGSLAKFCNIVKPMRKSQVPISPFKREKLDARLILSCLLFPYPAIIQHSTVQKYAAFSVTQWFGVYLM